MSRSSARRTEAKAAEAPIVMRTSIDARAVVFDFYGTLTVSATRASRVAGTARVAAVLGIPADRFHAAIVSTFSARATGSCGDASQTMQWLAEQCGGSPSAAQIAAACAVRLANEEVDTRALRDDAEATVSTLHNAGCRLGLISDCTHELPEIWPSLPIARYFNATVFSVEIGVRKPHLDTYRAVTEALGVDPSDCLYVGDGGSNELTGARQAGLRAIQLLTSDAAEAIVYDLDATWEGPRIRSLSEVIGVAASPSSAPSVSKR
jgi:putative hydrolase of the HAD superfamily